MPASSRSGVAKTAGASGQPVPRQSKVPLPPYVQQQQQKMQLQQQSPQQTSQKQASQQQGSQAPGVAHKYPFFQVQNNRDSSKYRTPYATWGGFTNGYEGSLRSQLMMSTSKARASVHRRGNSFSLGGGLMGLSKPARHLNYSDGGAEDELSPNTTFRFPNPQSDSVLQSPSSLSLDLSATSPMMHEASPPPPSYFPETSLSLLDPWEAVSPTTTPMHMRPQFSPVWQPFIGPLGPLESMNMFGPLPLGSIGPMGPLGAIGPMGPASQGKGSSGGATAVGSSSACSDQSRTVGPFGGPADVVFTTPGLTMNPTTPPPMSPLTHHVPSTPPGSRGSISQHMPGTPSVPGSPASNATSHQQSPEEQLKQQLRRISDPPQSP